MIRIVKRKFFGNRVRCPRCKALHSYAEGDVDSEEIHSTLSGKVFIKYSIGCQAEGCGNVIQVVKP